MNVNEPAWYQCGFAAPILLLAAPGAATLACVIVHAHADRSTPTDMIALTCNEIRRLFVALILEPARKLACPLAWSHWRRRHQHHARTHHYQRQQATHHGHNDLQLEY